MAPAPQGPVDPIQAQGDLDVPFFASKTFMAAVVATLGAIGTIWGDRHTRGFFDPAVVMGAITAATIAWGNFFQRQGTVNAVKRATHKILANQPPAPTPVVTLNQPSQVLSSGLGQPANQPTNVGNTPGG